MRPRRVYLSQPLPRPLSAPERLCADRDTSRYLATVLRCRRGDKLHVFDGRGGSYLAEIDAVDRQAVSLRVLEFVPDKARATLRITLACGVSRGPRMDYAVQKATELGAHRIAPLFTRRGNVRLDERRLQTRAQHWRKIAIHACEQCGRNDVPELLPPQEYTQWLAREAAAPSAMASVAKLVFSPDGGPLPDDHVPPPASCVLLLGPEGGLSPDELRQAAAAGYDVIRLGPRILRAETAVAAALTATQLLWGDLRAAGEERERRGDDP